MVVQDSVTFFATQIGSQVDRSEALNYIRTEEYLLVSSSKMVPHMFCVHHNWSLLKSDRFSLQITLPVSIAVGLSSRIRGGSHRVRHFTVNMCLRYASGSGVVPVR